METRLIYSKEYTLPLNVTIKSVEKYCYDYNIEMEKIEEKTKTYTFYASNPHQLNMLGWRFLLKH